MALPFLTPLPSRSQTNRKQRETIFKGLRTTIRWSNWYESRRKSSLLFCFQLSRVIPSLEQYSLVRFFFVRHSHVNLSWYMHVGTTYQIEDYWKGSATRASTAILHVFKKHIYLVTTYYLLTPFMKNFENFWQYISETPKAWPACFWTGRGAGYVSLLAPPYTAKL